MEAINIERFFLNTLLRVSIGGVLLITLTDVFIYPADRISIGIDVTVLAAASVSYLLRKKLATLSVLILTILVLAAMVYQCIMLPISTTNSLSIILLVGFIHSVMLKRWLLWVMQFITVLAVNGILVYQFVTPGMMYTRQPTELVTIGVTYSIIFFILTYAAAVLKANYDRINGGLIDSNQELKQKATKIELQNEELVAMQEKLNSLNANLERMVHERTRKIQLQNEILLKYSYTNAHELRGPVARLLGLANIYRLESTLDADFIITRMTEQATEIDTVVRKINVELESGHQPGTA